MTFTSPVFLACLVPFIALFHFSKARWRPLVLVLTSTTFYIALDPWWALLLGTLTGLTFVVGRRMAVSEHGRATVFAAAVVSLVSVLSFFKYAPQIAHSVAGARASLLDHVLLPLGISYYVFKLLSYLIDVYWEKLQPEQDFLAFAAYVSFLPQLPAGPIQRAGDFLTQLRAPSASMTSGLRLLLFGLFQKLVVADRAAEWVDRVFASSGSALDPAAALLAIYAYAIQLYADFSGISDIAIGLGRVFGIDCPANFRTPYFAENISDFWRRWHISLTSWLSDYVFVPLRMATRNWGRFGLGISLMVNMLLVGLWHAASVPLLLFGALHGVIMVFSVMTKKPRDAWFKGRPALRASRAIWGPLLTFHTVALSLVFVRSPDVATAYRVFAQAATGVKHIVTRVPTDWTRVLFIEPYVAKAYREDLIVIVLGLVVMALVHGRPALTRWLLACPAWARWSWYYLAVLTLLVLAKSGPTGFIYSRF